MLFRSDDVRAMPMQLETIVTAATVSGGQQQRLLLARALARSVRLVLLDEATSAMDDVSQAAVMASLQEMDATRVVVAHRLSTVRSADRIVVVDGGRIVEDGTYDDLMGLGAPEHLRDIGHFVQFPEKRHRAS